MISSVEVSPGLSELGLGTSGGSIRGEQPILSWNEENPVHLFMVLMMLNQIMGRA